MLKSHLCLKIYLQNVQNIEQNVQLLIWWFKYFFVVKLFYSIFEIQITCMKMKNSIGANLRKYRLLANIKQEEAAKQLQISRTTLSHYENNDASPNMAILEKMASCYKTTIQLLSETNNA